MQAPISDYYKNAEGLLSGYDGGAAQAREAYGRNVNDISGADNNIWGAETPAYARDKVRDSRLFRNTLDLGKNLMQAKQDEIGFKNQGYMQLGAATAPDLVQTGSTGTSSGTSSGTSTDSPINSAGKIMQIAM